jgi:hypothetical protein
MENAMTLYETIHTQRISAEDFCSSEPLALMPMASYCPSGETQSLAEREVDQPPYPFFAFDDEDEDDLDDEDDFDDLDDFDDEGYEDDDDFEDDDSFEDDDYEDDIEYDDYDE